MSVVSEKIARAEKAVVEAAVNWAKTYHGRSFGTAEKARKARIVLDEAVETLEKLKASK